MKDPLYTFDDDTGTASCIIEYDGLPFCGVASCHEHDMDMCSPKVGTYIAELRAKIKFLQYQKRLEKAKLGALKQLYFSMNRSKDFNPKSYEARTLFRQIKRAETDIKNTNIMIEEYKIEIKRYIDTKDIFYKEVRKHRTEDKNK